MIKHHCRESFPTLQCAPPALTSHVDSDLWLFCGHKLSLDVLNTAVLNLVAIILRCGKPFLEMS